MNLRFMQFGINGVEIIRSKAMIYKYMHQYMYQYMHEYSGVDLITQRISNSTYASTGDRSDSGIKVSAGS